MYIGSGESPLPWEVRGEQLFLEQPATKFVVITFIRFSILFKKRFIKMGKRRNLPEKQKRKLGIKNNAKYNKMKDHRFLIDCGRLVRLYSPKKKRQQECQ